MATINRYLLLLAAIVLGLGLLSAGSSALGFEFNGTVLFPNGTGANNTNITIYIFANASSLTNAFTGTSSWSTYANETGIFNFSTPINDGPGLIFSLLIKYGSGPWGNVSTNFTGPLLPPMPKEMFMMISNSTMYMQPAVNINITAYNLTSQPQFISGQVMDNKLGYPIHTFTMTTQSWAVVPANRNYTVLLWTDIPPIFTGWNRNGFSPPRAYVFTNVSSYLTKSMPAQIDVNKNIATTLYTINGTLKLAPGVTNSSGHAMNYTKVVPYLFIPSVNNMTVYEAFMDNATGWDTNINSTYTQDGFYNITLVGPGIDYVIAGFGNDSATTYFAGFTNITVNSNAVANISLSPLAGSFYRTGAINTSKTVFCFINGDTNTTLSEQVRVEVKTVYNGTEMRWQTQSNSTGCINMPLLNSTAVTVSAFGGRFAPREFTITGAQLNARQAINISLRKFNPQNPDGGAFSGAVEINFLRSNGTCDVPSPPAGCTLSTFSDAASFNPLKAALGGNLSFRMVYQGVVIHYKGVDIIASGPPDAEFDSVATETTSGSNFLSVWKLGSMAPFKVYDYVLIGLPYEASDIDDSGAFNITIKNLYYNNWTSFWTTSTDGIDPGARYPEYADYNTSWFSGMTCDKDVDIRINTTQSCYVNTTSNYIWLHIPHFSGGNTQVTAAKTTTAATPATTGGSSGGGGAGGAGATSSTYWSTIDAGTATTMQTYGIAMPVAAVEFTLSEATNAVKMTVSVLSSIPTIVASEPSGTVYKYVDIIAQNVDSTKISSATIKFRVDKAWITENNVDTSTIKLARYTNTWEILETKSIGEDAAYAHFEAKTPGFSHFAILAQTKAGEAVTTLATTTTTTTTQPTFEIPQQLQKPANIGILAAIIAVLIGIGCILTRKKSRYAARYRNK